MTLTPDDVERQVFKQEFRGYDQGEVDRFLDQVTDSLGVLIRERDELAARLEQLQAQAEQSGETERLLRRTLVTAQRTADETVAEARQQADEILSEARREAEEARREAEETIDSARREADELMVDARREATWAREQAHAEAERLQRTVEELRRFGDDYRQRVRAVIAGHLDVLDRAGDLPDLPAAFEELARLTGRLDDEAPAAAESGVQPD